MPAKKLPAKPGAAAPPAQLARGDAAAPADGLDVNIEYKTKFANALTLIRCHKVFAEASSSPALGFADGGVTLPFKETDFHNQMTISTTKQYEAGSNVFWLNLSWSPDPGVPIIEGNIRKLQSRYFATPNKFPFTLVVGITDHQFKAGGSAMVKNCSCGFGDLLSSSCALCLEGTQSLQTRTTDRAPCEHGNPCSRAPVT